jgi:hypothetical protein
VGIVALGLIPLGLLWGILALAAPAAAQTPSEASPEDAPPRWSLSGDARLRLESDFDSRNPGGQLRDDRDRLRLRLRLAGGYRLSDRTALGARLRTGSRDSQQSAHVTLHDFDDNPTGDHHVLLDRWFVRHERERGWVWLGRNGGSRPPPARRPSPSPRGSTCSTASPAPSCCETATARGTTGSG